MQAVTNGRSSTGEAGGVVATHIEIGIMRLVEEFEYGCFSPITLDSAGTAEHGRDCLEKNLDIEPDRPLINVPHIESHPFVKADRASSHYLPKASDTRLDAESAAMPVLRESLIVPQR